jgi:L-lactate dehydrogenase complex protein LldG
MSRTVILDRIRAALHVDLADLERRSAAAARLAEPPRHLVPACAKRPAAALVDQFQAALGARRADLIPVSTPAHIPAAAADYLRVQHLPLQVRAGTDPYLAALPWDAVPGLALETGPAQGNDGAGISRALAGVAETGTLVLASSADNPVTLAFVPDTHLVVVEAQAIVGSYEDAIERVAAELGHGVLPRTLNLVSGPSRTGDIGGQIVLGAHGPRRLAVLLVGERAS